MAKTKAVAMKIPMDSPIIAFFGRVDGLGDVEGRGAVSGLGLVGDALLGIDGVLMRARPLMCRAVNVLASFKMLTSGLGLVTKDRSDKTMG